ncbi:hypothetical protein AQUSIP_06520 [Aquicella siphonis]|uniref:DUF6968 domain-containing protein n=1 Tax=Aquicella siphonis TaxID=254247 RepID=A0A5E4PFR4_9COXI|nr:hypothetical protein [Aquicella siphonis]VVC75362.1 hypothetical protein AQUSIP_06520 [Aquicella siphonis]
MQLTEIGQVVASRTLTLTDNNATRLVIISIGKPQKFSDGQDYYCPYQIFGLRDEKVNWCGGIDEVQALLLALERIGIVLADTDEYKQGKLTWIGSENNNIGFPHPDSSGLLSDLRLESDIKKS